MNEHTAFRYEYQGRWYLGGKPWSIYYDTKNKVYQLHYVI